LYNHLQLTDQVTDMRVSGVYFIPERELQKTREPDLTRATERRSIIKLYPIRSSDQLMIIDMYTDLFMLNDTFFFQSNHRYGVNPFRPFVLIFHNYPRH